MASPPTVKGGSSGSLCPAKVRKCGYLKKQKHGHKRFFVLRERGGGCPARLEYYENEKKWRNKSSAKRVVSLECCLSINKRADAKHKYLIALYTKDEYLAVAADSEPEQHSWFTALSDLLPPGSGSSSPLLPPPPPPPYTDHSDYGPLPTALYKQVWQVNLKPKGLGQVRNLSGVYMLCLSSQSMGLVKLNCELPSVSLQLMNIRRCGHSENFFFIEVGRSASTGPGELWMQVDDSVVAQHIHETILEAMKAMKELCEFRPRSKSQSSGSHPISVPGRRHLVHLPPSQAGLLHRRSRTDSIATPSHAGKIVPSRTRTASEGDSSVCRLESMTGSPISPSSARTHFSRLNTMSKNPRAMQPNSLHHSQSMSMPVSHSPLSATSPVSLSSSSGHGSASDTIARPSSANASVSGSPSDGGFISFDEYGSSPGDLRQYMGYRNNTPESLTYTPPVRECNGLYGYMLMERHASGRCGLGCSHIVRDESSDKSYRKRTYSLTTPCRQRAISQVSSVSLDAYTLMKATCIGNSEHLSCPVSPNVAYNPYPEDYCDIQVGSQKNSGCSNLGDDGYMPMTHGMGNVPHKNDDYMPMSPKSVSAPKQIINPRSHSQVNVSGYKNISPTGCCLPDTSQYKRMWCGSKLLVESSDGKFTSDEYMNMSPVDHCASVTPPDCFFPVSEELPRSSDSFYTFPQSHKPHCQKDGGNDHYVLMSLPHGVILEEPALNVKCGAPSVVNQAAHSPVRQSLVDGLAHRERVMRPSRLSLEMLRANTLSSPNEPASLPEPKSPGEYVSINFSNKFPYIAPSVPHKSSLSFPDSANVQKGLPVSDYMNVDLNSKSPKNGFVSISSFDTITGSTVSCPSRNLPVDVFLKSQVGTNCLAHPSEDETEYTEMAFIMATTPPLPVPPKQVDSPTTGMERLSLIDHMPGVDVFILPSLAPDPNRGAKVIRANPQGRRRHSSETFSSTTTVTPVSPSFAHDPKRHSSASFENVSLRKNEEAEAVQGSPISRKTSAGIQSGLNYVALGLGDDNFLSYEKVAQYQLTPQRKEISTSLTMVHIPP
ncbi:insulin receptor substrate 2 [Amblyraja radiata]|uniref:insulin receptor substrate 2 n=1 Tax=Amblyraja radiata TaxID=386614 RepID=UPI0014029702|nr:insulin receptor substrate 2 [Amblyraja radiata]